MLKRVYVSLNPCHIKPNVGDHLTFVQNPSVGVIKAQRHFQIFSLLILGFRLKNHKAHYSQNQSKSKKPNQRHSRS